MLDPVLMDLRSRVQVPTRTGRGALCDWLGPDLHPLIWQFAMARSVQDETVQGYASESFPFDHPTMPRRYLLDEVKYSTQLQFATLWKEFVEWTITVPELHTHLAGLGLKSQNSTYLVQAWFI